MTETGKLMFVTLGAEGAWVLQGEYKTHVPAVPAQVLEPTGAGDSFAGATLARLAQGQHPVQAARLAMPLAAQVVTGIGPAALLEDKAAPPPPADGHVTVNGEQVQRIASLIARPCRRCGPSTSQAQNFRRPGNPIHWISSFRPSCNNSAFGRPGMTFMTNR